MVCFPFVNFPVASPHNHMKLKKVSVLGQNKFLIKVRVVVARVYAFAAYVPIDKDDILSAKNTIG